MLGIVWVEQAIACGQPYPLSVEAIDAEDVITNWGSGLRDLGQRMPICTDEVAGGVVDGVIEGSIAWRVFENLGMCAEHSLGRRVRGFDTAVAADDRHPVVECVHHGLEVLFGAAQGGLVGADQHIAVVYCGGGDPHGQSRSVRSVVGAVNDSAVGDDRGGVQRRADRLAGRECHCS